MTRATKVGLSGVALTLLAFLPFSTTPIPAALLFLSGVLGYIASTLGSKWWLLLPVVIVCACAALLYVAWHSM